MCARREGAKLKAYLVQRLIAIIPVMLIVGVVVFSIIHITPGCPAAVMLGPDATPDEIEALRDRMGLNEPALVQLISWFGGILRGDFGFSIFLRMPVLKAIAERAEPTLLLTLFSCLIAVTVGVMAGLLAAVKRNSWVDQMVMVLALVGVSMPTFWLGLNLIYLFSLTLGWFPVAGYVPVSGGIQNMLRHMVLPSITLGFMSMGLIARMTRSCMLEVLGQDYIRVARSKGLAERVVIYKHAFRNALIPTMTVIGLTFAILMGGAIITETVFTIPGVGRLMISSVLRRDYPLIQGTVMIIAGLYVFINLIIDIIYVYIDPRIEYT